MENRIKNMVFNLFNKHKGFIISIIITIFYLLINFKYPFEIKNLNSNSMNCLSILFGFNMVVVTQYYSNVKFNLFLKKAGRFNGFKEKYRNMAIFLIISLIIIYSLSIFEELDFLIFNLVCKSVISNLIIVFLSLFNLFKSLEIIREFFNVYGTTYSNTFMNTDLDNTDNNPD